MTKESQLNYERGIRSPDAVYLQALAGHGVDVLYLLTGRREATVLPDDESELMRLYRNAPLALRPAAMAAVAALSAGAAPAAYQQNFEGANVGQQVGGDVTGPFTINMGSTRTRKKRDNEQD